MKKFQQILVSNSDFGICRPCRTLLFEVYDDFSKFHKRYCAL